MREQTRRPPLLAIWVAALAALCFAVTAFSDAPTVAIGSCAIVFCAACGVAAAQVFRSLDGPDDSVEPRHLGPSADEERATALGTLEGGARAMAGPTRGAMLVAALSAFGAAVVLALLAPLRSLGHSGQESPAGWTPGARLARDDGSLVRADDLEVGSVLTVFPAGTTARGTTATLLLRTPEGAVAMPPERQTWTPNGYIAFSKICTHAGCPVALYRRESEQLYCPCHQSTFDVYQRAKPIAGPATRALPQLPLQVDRDGFLVAQHDYVEQVGPDAWSRT